MSGLQRAIENLLLVTEASRAMLGLRDGGSGFAIAAEAVQHDAAQIRHQASAADRDAAFDLRDMQGGPSIVLHDNVAVLPAGSAPAGVKAQMRAPLLRDGRLIGLIALHQCVDARAWRAGDRHALEEARFRVLELLEQSASARDELGAAAIQAVLDQARRALDAQRCTFRQPVQQAYAFPVTFESREPQVRSLLGDFTIVQTGQPVIVKLLAERAQVIQEDCRVASADPLFHKMLAHYGGMRAQMVTPYIMGDELHGVLSVHELRDTRVWTAAERTIAAEAAALIGGIATTARS
jgi:twitching motility protein PilJ